MKERPILFSAPMVRAILEGRKTQTRRLVKPKASAEGLLCDPNDGAMVLGSEHLESLEIQGFECVAAGDGGYWVFPPCPYGEVGDRIWVRENWKPDEDGDVCCITYQADAHKRPIENTKEAADRWVAVRRPCEQWPELKPPAWRPSIHMPRWASRILLEVVSVRVERLKDVSDEDALAEGCAGGHGVIPRYGYSATPQEHFRWLWESINGTGSWDANPWVWVVDFGG